MHYYTKEVKANFGKFSSKWKKELIETINEEPKNLEVFEDSYFRITTLNAWKSEVLEDTLSQGSLQFLIEAQNDALTSHSLIQIGAWRSALKSLRSVIENIVNCLYFMDHEVEYKLWELGKFRLGFTAGINYLK
ncbi:hypothetical protein WDZ92_54120, partial [Nostoc sp. NIES-2111]